MRFKAYIEETPALPMVDIECPYIHHKGGIINGNSNKFNYDTVIEVQKDSSLNQTMNSVYLYGNNRFGDAPVVCRQDMKVFMWDGKDSTYAPVKPEDIEMCNKFIEALNSPKSKERNGGIDFSQATILKPEESKR